MKKTLLTAAMTLVAMTSGASATTLNIDFGIHGEPADSYGAASGQTGVWNGITALGLTSGLVDLSGAATTASLNLSADFIYGNTSQANNVLIQDNFYSNAGHTWSFSLSGLDVGAYDIYYYAATNSAVSTGPFTVNGVATASLYGATSLIEGASWAHLSNVVVDGSGTLSFASTSTSGYRGIAGLQIMGGIPDVPEPAGLGLLGLGLLGLGLARKRRG